ncbi:hypothetical protein EW767_07495 [Salmonella enterica]|nr:hypothetical protein [Salmonella enterica]
MTSKDSNVSSIPELTDFEVSYSLLTNEVYLSTSFTDNIACIPNWPLQEFPQKAIDYMNAGIERRSENLIQ